MLELTFERRVGGRSQGDKENSMPVGEPTVEQLAGKDALKNHIGLHPLDHFMEPHKRSRTSAADHIRDNF